MKSGLENIFGQSKVALRGRLLRGWTFLRSGDDDGAVLVEIAATIPIMMLLTFGAWSMGISLYNYVALTQAVNNASRLIAVSRDVYPVTFPVGGSSYTDACALAIASVKADAPNLNPALMTITVTIAGTPYSTATCSAGTSALNQNAYAGVSVTYPCIAPPYSSSGGSLCTLKAKTAVVIQ